MGGRSHAEALSFLDEGCSVRDHILLLGVAVKYQALRVLRRVLVLLKYHCPDTLDGYDHWHDESVHKYDCPVVSRLPGTSDIHMNETFLLLKIAHNCGMQILLPATYHIARGEPAEVIVAHARDIELPNECLHNLLAGQRKLHSLARTSVYGPLFGPNRDVSEQCKHPLDCHEARHHIINTEIEYHPFRKWIDPGLSRLCKPCRGAVMDAYRRGRAEVWVELPSVFGLPGWDALRKARDEVLGELLEPTT